MMAQNLRPVSLNFTAPRPYAKGGLAAKAEEVRASGRGGDTMLVHVNPIEFHWLQKNFGGGTNPSTGLPEFSFWDYLLPVAANVIAPGIGSAVGDAIGSVTGNALPSALTSALGSAATGAGINALTGNDIGTGAVVGGLSPSVLSALGLTGAGGALSGLNMFPGAAKAATAAATPAVSPNLSGLGGGSSSPAGAASTTSSLMKEAPLLLAAAAIGGASKPDQSAPQMAGQTNDQNKKTLSNITFDRTQTNPEVTTRYGYGSEKQFFKDNQLPTVAAAQGTYVKGGGTGTSDSIPAKLSDGEYVIDAQTVSMLGDGSSDAGAQKLDQMREAIRKQKGGALSKGKFAPDAKSPLSYIRGTK